MGYSPWGCKELDVTEELTHTQVHELRRENSPFATGRTLVRRVSVECLAEAGLQWIER